MCMSNALITNGQGTGLAAILAGGLGMESVIVHEEYLKYKEELEKQNRHTALYFARCEKKIQSGLKRCLRN